MVDSFTWKGGGGEICFHFLLSVQRSLVRESVGARLCSENLDSACCTENKEERKRCVRKGILIYTG